MRRAYWVLIAIGILIVATAAARKSRAAAGPAIAQATPAASVTAAAPAGTVSASVEVQPAQESNLGFVIAAPVKQINVKEGEQVKAGQTLIVLDTPDRVAAVASAQADLKSALANQAIQHAGRQTRVQQGHRSFWLGSMPEIRQQADARVLQAQAAVEVAQANLAQGTLVAPFDGTVVSIDVQPAEMVEAQKAILVLGDLGHLQVVTTDLSEREIANVHIGQSTKTRLKAFNEDLTGKVVAISPLANENNGDTVYKVTIELDKQPDGLLWGMTGDVEINTK
jgi:membrane fusion protein (multidrug efflux system)